MKDSIKHLLRLIKLTSKLRRIEVVELGISMDYTVFLENAAILRSNPLLRLLDSDVFTK